MQYSNDDEQVKKVFVGGLNKDSTDERSLNDYFQKWGNVMDTIIMRDQLKNSRGFGFVVYETDDAVESIMQAKKDGTSFKLDERVVEVKRAVPRTSQPAPKRGLNYRKLFVGGLPSTADQNDISEYFGTFGKVEEVLLLRDKETERLRGFGFVTFEDEDSSDRCLQKRTHTIQLKDVEVKRAEAFVAKEKSNRYSPYDRRPTEVPAGYGSQARLGTLDIATVNQMVAEAHLQGFNEGFAQSSATNAAPAPMVSIADAAANPLLRALKSLLASSAI